VKGLTAVPQVLSMMNDKLDWTQQLGEAFLPQPNDVSNSIQQLRAKASVSPWRALSVSANGMMALLDGPGAVDGSGRTVYSYVLDAVFGDWGRRRDLRWPFPLLPRFARGRSNSRQFLYRR
jgi:hypothetical protein